MPTDTNRTLLSRAHWTGSFMTAALAAVMITAAFITTWIAEDYFDIVF